MATILYTTYEINPQDVGYVIQHDHYDGGQKQTTMIGIGEATAPQAAKNYAAIVSKAQAAIAANKTFLAIGSPTNAQAIAQSQALTRQMNAVILFLLQALTGLTDISGT